MIQRLTNLNGLSIVTNYLHPSQPDASNYNIKEFDMNNQGVLLLKVSGLTYSYVDELAKMKLIIPVTNMSNGVKFFAREVTTTYTTSVKWPGPSVNTSQIEGEHEIEYTYGSGISAPEIYYVILDLTNLARKWKKNGILIVGTQYVQVIFL